MTKEMKRRDSHRLWWTRLSDEINVGNKEKERDNQFSELSDGTIF